MIVLSRENILEGLIELQEEEKCSNKITLNNISYILNRNDLDDIDKLKNINIELSKLMLA